MSLGYENRELDLYVPRKSSSGGFNGGAGWWWTHFFRRCFPFLGLVSSTTRIVFRSRRFVVQDDCCMHIWSRSKTFKVATSWFRRRRYRIARMRSALLRRKSRLLIRWSCCRMRTRFFSRWMLSCILAMANTLRDKPEKLKLWLGDCRGNKSKNSLDWSIAHCSASRLYTCAKCEEPKGGWETRTVRFSSGLPLNSIRFC